MRTSNPTKPRKPYKITKPRERWNEQEHEKFLEAIDKFGRDWKQIVTYIGTRSVSQVRSHAQKHFIRLEKKGLGDVVPPARRKARWADKRSAGFCDTTSESEQDFAALHQQTSSSSMSTLDHQAIYPFPAGQSLEGSGSSVEYSDCQPLSSRTHSLGSLASRNTSFTSPASQTDFIAYAQEMLLHRQDATPPATTSAGHAQPFNPQQLQPEQRQFVLDMLQQLAAQQQALGLAGALPGTEGLSGNAQLQPQQCVRQFLQHQQFAQQQPALLASHQLSVAAPVDTWHKRESVKAPAPEPETAPASTATMTQDYTSLTPTPSPSSTVTDYLAASAQQPAAPRLDGAFLAECFQSPRLAAGAKNLAWQGNSNQGFPCPTLANNLASQNMLSQSLPGKNSPNASLASTAHCYTSSSPSPAPCSSCMSVMKPEPLLNSQVASAATPLADSLGLMEDIDFWGGVGFEDPLMQAVDAAMGCTDESENSCFNMTTPEF